MTPTDRRRTARRITRPNRARLEWSEGAEFRETEARLLDLSGGGARVVAEVIPPVDQPVWIRLEEPTLTGWVSAKVVRVGTSLEAGLAFSGYCPFDFHETMIRGIDGQLN